MFVATVNNVSVTSGNTVFQLQGSSTKKVFVWKTHFSAYAASGLDIPLAYVRRSTNTTGGGKTNITVGKFDTSLPNPTAVASYYSSAASQGTLVHLLYAENYGTNAGSDHPDNIMDLGLMNEAIVLNGNTDFLTIDVGGKTCNFACTVYFSEA